MDNCEGTKKVSKAMSEALDMNMAYSENKEGIEMFLGLLSTIIENHGPSVGKLVGTVLASVKAGIDPEVEADLIDATALAKTRLIKIMYCDLDERFSHQDKVALIVAALRTR